MYYGLYVIRTGQETEVFSLPHRRMPPAYPFRFFTFIYTCSSNGMKRVWPDDEFVPTRTLMKKNV